MAEKDNENNELLKQVLAELKTINERNKKADEKEEKKNRNLEISDAEFVFLIFGVVIGFLAQVLYDALGSLFTNVPSGKFFVGIGIVIFFMLFIIRFDRNRRNNMKSKTCTKS